MKGGAERQENGIKQDELGNHSSSPGKVDINRDNSQHLLRHSLPYDSQCSEHLASVNLFNSYRQLL